jgi:hypothetical protein
VFFGFALLKEGKSSRSSIAEALVGRKSNMPCDA